MYSHRGHASFVLAAAAILALVARRWKWISKGFFATALALIIPALLLTKTRAGILALIVALFYLLGRKYYKLLIPIALSSLLVVGIITASRPIDHRIPVIRQIVSTRFYLWEVAVRGISDRPLLGWGFDGFGNAYPYVRDRNWMPKQVRLNNFSFDYLDSDGQLRTRSLVTVKAHNLILDTILSTGILGMLSYFTLLLFYLYRAVKSPYRGLDALVIAYLAFTLLWFECAQFTHLVWWSLCLCGNDN